MKKRLTSLFLCFVLLLGLIPVGAGAAGSDSGEAALPDKYSGSVSGTEGSGETIYVLDTDGVDAGGRYLIVAPDKEKALSYTENDDRIMSGQKDITIEKENGVHTASGKNLKVWEISSSGTIESAESEGVYVCNDGTKFVGRIVTAWSIEHKGNGKYTIQNNGRFLYYNSGFGISGSNSNLSNDSKTQIRLFKETSTEGGYAVGLDGINTLLADTESLYNGGENSNGYSADNWSEFVGNYKAAVSAVEGTADSYSTEDAADTQQSAVNSAAQELYTAWQALKAESVVLTVNYICGTSIIDTDEYYCAAGATLTVTAKSLGGYTLIGSDSKTVTVEDGMSVSFYYEVDTEEVGDIYAEYLCTSMKITGSDGKTGKYISAAELTTPQYVTNLAPETNDSGTYYFWKARVIDRAQTGGGQNNDGGADNECITETGAWDIDALMYQDGSYWFRETGTDTWTKLNYTESGDTGHQLVFYYALLFSEYENVGGVYSSDWGLDSQENNSAVYQVKTRVIEIVGDTEKERASEKNTTWLANGIKLLTTVLDSKYELVKTVVRAYDGNNISGSDEVTGNGEADSGVWPREYSGPITDVPSLPASNTDNSRGQVGTGYSYEVIYYIREKTELSVSYEWLNHPNSVSLPVDASAYKSGDTVTVDSTYTEGGTVTEGAYLYTFSGWHTDSAMTQDAPESFAISGDTILYGNWTRELNDAITITANSAEKVYDGTPLSDSGYTVSYLGSLIDPNADGSYTIGGEIISISATVSGSITDVGSTANKVSSYSVDNANASTKYNVRIVDGTLTVTPKLISISVTKIWDDKANEAGKRPESVQVRLTADGAAVEATEVSLSEANSWTHTWDGLPAYSGGAEIEYSVMEIAVPEGYKADISGDMERGFTVTNSYPAKYTVSYTYTGDVPVGAPEVPEDAYYASGEQVCVAAAPTLEGYTFSGWSMNDFTMPAQNVEITGSWSVGKYGYTVNYYKDSVAAENLVGNETGTAGFGSDIPYTNGAYAPAGYNKVGTVSGQTKVTATAAENVLNIVYTALPRHSVTYSWSGIVPAGVNLPTDNNRYYEGQRYNLNDDYTAVKMVETRDEYGNVNGRYTFSGWSDPNGGKMGDADVTVSGTWSYESVSVEAHKVSYSWSGDIPADAVLPTDAKTYVKGQSYEVDTTYTSATEVETTDEYGNVNGRYTFSGWSDPNSGRMGDTDVTVSGIWSYAAVRVETHKVSYSYEGAIPEGAVELLPADEYYVPNMPVTVAAAPTLEGYIFSGWNRENFTMPAEDVNISGSWTTNEYRYSVEYYFDGNIDSELTESGEASYATGISEYTDKVKNGYKLDKTENLPMTVSADVNKNVIKVYYITDEAQTKTLSYTVEYYKDGVKADTDTQTVTATVQLLQPDTLTVDKAAINTADKYEGYRLDRTEPAVIPDSIENGGVIKVYYITDEAQTKTLSYTVEYYKDGVKVEADTQTVEKTVQLLRPDTLTVDKAAINTADKYEGYKLDRTEPAEIPDGIENGGVIKVYYITDEAQTKTLNYTVEYYKDGVKVEVDTQTVEKTVQLLQPDTLTVDKAAINTADKYEGYKLDRTEPAEIPDSIENGGVIKVYYITDEAQTKTLNYTVEYYKDGVKVEADTQTVEKTVQLLQPDTLTVDKVAINTTNKYNAYKFQKTEPAVIPDSIENGGVIKVYYIINVRPNPKPPTLNKEDHVAYIIGYPDGTVRPDSSITRAEAVTIFFRLLSEESREYYWTEENSFTDVGADAWCRNAISTLSNAGIITGYADGTFRPNEPITRAEFAAMAARFSDVAYDGDSTFNDVDDSHWAERFIALAEHLGWVSGYADGSFGPEQAITRAEAITLINRVLERAVDAENMLPGMLTWEDNTPDAWYYEAVQEATNSHEYVRTEESVPEADYCFEKWTALRPSPDWVALEKNWAESAGK